MLQPLGVGVYGPLKQVWKNINMQLGQATWEKKTFLHRSWGRSFKPDHLKGFKEVGLLHSDTLLKVATALYFHTACFTMSEMLMQKELRMCCIDTSAPAQAKYALNPLWEGIDKR